MASIRSREDPLVGKALPGGRARKRWSSGERVRSAGSPTEILMVIAFIDRFFCDHMVSWEAIVEGPLAPMATVGEGVRV